MMVELGVTPLQGIDRGLDAIFNACTYSAGRSRILGSKSMNRFRVIEFPESLDLDSGLTMNEWDSKQRLKSFGIRLPDGQLVRTDSPAEGAAIACGEGQPLGCDCQIESSNGLPQFAKRNAFELL